MQTVTGMFENFDRASRAVAELKDAGIPAENISILANSPGHITGSDFVVEDEAEHIAGDAEAGVAAGAVIGGASGLLAGLGVLVIPGIGPVIAGGWLVATAIGAATGAIFGLAAGGVVGALTEVGIPEPDAHVYAEGVRRGGALVGARVEGAQIGIAEAILHHADGVDIARRRRTYEAEGWTAFKPEPHAGAAGTGSIAPKR